VKEDPGGRGGARGSSRDKTGVSGTRRARGPTTRPLEEERMRPLALSLAALLLTSAAASAQDWAKQRLDKSPRHGEWVKLKHDKREVQAFVVYPEVKEKVTAVLVIHEIFGLTDWARSVADELAEAGYLAIAPDLLSGMGPKGGGTAEFGGDDA